MIDWNRIAELQSEIGTEDFGEVAEIFLDELGSTVARMAQEPEASDMAARLHFVKGCALNLGFREMADRAAAGERAIAAGGAVDLGELVDCLKASRTAFAERFGDVAA